MTKQRIQGFLAGLLAAILLIATFAIASPAIREVFYGVNVVVDGVPQDFDADSQPFISDGRTFLPVRAIAEALGVDVNWDGETQTVYIGETPARTTPIEHPIIGRWNTIEAFEDGVLVYPEDDENYEYEMHWTFFPNGEGYVEMLWVANFHFFWTINSEILTMNHEGEIVVLQVDISGDILTLSGEDDWGYYIVMILERID